MTKIQFSISHLTLWVVWFFHIPYMGGTFSPHPIYGRWVIETFSSNPLYITSGGVTGLDETWQDFLSLVYYLAGTYLKMTWIYCKKNLMNFNPTDFGVCFKLGHVFHQPLSLLSLCFWLLTPFSTIFQLFCCLWFLLMDQIEVHGENYQHSISD